MIMSSSDWTLVVAAAIFLVAVGGLISSLLNHRQLALNTKKLTDLAAQVNHTNNNARAVKQALEVKLAKDDARHALPVDVTIVNRANQAVPVEDVSETCK